jgi:hypothetical protein
MATTRKQDLRHMAATLEAWAGQIADLQVKARAAGAERRPGMSGRLAALRRQRRAYEAQMADTRGAGAAVFRDMQRGAKRIAEEFRRLHLQAASRFARRARASFATATVRQTESCCREKDAGP